MKIVYALKRYQHHDAFIGLSKSWFAKCFEKCSSNMWSEHRYIYGTTALLSNRKRRKMKY